MTDRVQPTEHRYRLGHPLAEAVVGHAKDATLPARAVAFLYRDHPAKVSVLEQLRGQTGWLQAAVLGIEALGSEEHLLLAAVTDSGAVLDADVAGRLFGVDGEAGPECVVPEAVASHLAAQIETAQQAIVAATGARNQRYSESEMEKLDSWAEGLKDDLEREIKEADKW